MHLLECEVNTVLSFEILKLNIHLKNVSKLIQIKWELQNCGLSQSILKSMNTIKQDLGLNEEIISW